ncbi:hypothetical protein EMMF5_001898 [Cystobasidiomycetes sp. EMM_F5]
MANNDEQARYMNNEKGKGRASVSDPEQNKGPQYASTQNSEADNKSDHNGRKVEPDVHLKATQSCI